MAIVEGVVVILEKIKPILFLCIDLQKDRFILKIFCELLCDWFEFLKVHTESSKEN